MLRGVGLICCLCYIVNYFNRPVLCASKIRRKTKGKFTKSIGIFSNFEFL